MQIEKQNQKNKTTEIQFVIINIDSCREEKLLKFRDPKLFG